MYKTPMTIVFLVVFIYNYLVELILWMILYCMTQRDLFGVVMLLLTSSLATMSISYQQGKERVLPPVMHRLEDSCTRIFHDLYSLWRY